jgi:hypothetical protein
MNLFEDLVVELKEQNLLESTVIESEDSDGATLDEVHVTSFPIDADVLPTGEETDQGDVESAPAETDGVASAADEHALEPESSTEIAQAEPAIEPEDAKNGKEFYQKRAVSEVSGLQMVEHVLTGVEREYMKIVPKTFDDFNAKRALHTFLNVANNISEEEHAAAEFTLMQETEAWCTALGDRDREIPVSSLRLYCENSRPALSSQALVGMARFYRNLPYSEQVRSKFDFTITRLFSRPIDNERRVCLFTRDEMLNHINTLYKEWSSIPLYTADDDESKVLLTALSFEDLAIEAESASTFDQLITSDFFSRLRLFKESISELFYAPNVTAAAIECNIRIGNAYVELIHREKAKLNEQSLESKYGDLNDQAVSDAAARTLQLVDLLRSRENVRPADEPASNATETPEPEAEAVVPADPNSIRSRITASFFAINRWFLIMSLLIVAGCAGVWIWANYIVVEKVSTAGVVTLPVEGTFLAEHITSARISNGTLYGVVAPTWDMMTKEKRQEFLQKVLQAGKDKGYTQVNLIGKGGKLSGYASPTRLDVITQH